MAVCIISAIPASAADVDLSNPDKTTNVRTNKPYIQFDIVSDEDIDARSIDLDIKDKNGEVVASCTVANNPENKNRFAYVALHTKTDFLHNISGNDHGRIKGLLSNKDMAEFLSIDTDSENDPQDKLYYISETYGPSTFRPVKDNQYLLYPDNDIYHTKSDTTGFDVVETITVPANKVFVDVDSRYVALNDRHTDLYLSGRYQERNSDYNSWTNRLSMYENAGKRVYFNAETGKHYVMTAGGNGGGNYLEVYDHETKYNKIKIKFVDAFPGFCDESLTWEHKFFEKTYKMDMRGDQSEACFSALYHSGAAVSASIPDKDGYIYIWLKEDAPLAFMGYNFNFPTGGGGGSMKYMHIPMTVEKIHSMFEYPTKNFSLYNIKPGKYTVEISDEKLRDLYTVSNNKFTVKNTQDLQSFNFKIVSKGFKLGDVNGDGCITVTDISLTAAHINGRRALSADEKKRADTNRDGAITVTDVSKIAAHVKGVKAIV